MLERLNENLSDFITKTEITGMEEFTFLNQLIAIFERNVKLHKSPQYKHTLPLHKSYQYSYEFLKSINSEYAAYLEKSFNNGVFEFLDKKTNIVAYSTVENEKHKIYLPVNNTIEDSYDITHEIIHDMSLNGNISEARHIFCEVFSYFAEELQYEYLKTHTNARDCDINHSNILACVTERNCILKYMQQFVGTYLNQGIITENDLVNLYVQSEYEQLFQYTIKEILENGAILFDYNQRYVIGIIFAYYMLDRVHTNKNNIQEFFDLNEVINAYDVVDFLHYLDLELTDSDIFDLTEESYRKLENSFVKILKRR